MLNNCIRSFEPHPPRIPETAASSWTTSEKKLVANGIVICRGQNIAYRNPLLASSVVDMLIEDSGSNGNSVGSSPGDDSVTDFTYAMV